MTGFLEESAGVRSMSRLTIAVLLVLTAVIVGTLCFYVLHVDTPSAIVTGALVGAIGALVLNGIVAIAKRGGVDDAAP